MDALRLLFPGDTVSLFEQTVEDLLSQTQGALLSVGFILSLYYASSSVHAVLSGFNESALLEQKGNPWLIRVWSMFLLILLVVLLGLAVLLIGFSGDALMWASDRGLLPGSSLPWFNAARWLGALVLIYSSVTLLYNVGHWDRLKWRTATPGAAMTTILMVLLSLGFSFFIAKVNTYNRLYGSLGTLASVAGLGEREQRGVAARIRAGREHREGPAGSHDEVFRRRTWRNGRERVSEG